MSENGRTIIVQQSQSQTQNGCCAGSGCGTIFAIALLIGLLATAWDGMMGVYGLGWQIALWILMPILLLLVLAGGFAALDQYFGWGYTSEESAPEADTRDPAEVIMNETVDERNYGSVPVSSESEIGDKLQQLADLRDRGLITNEDFEAKKRELLDNM